MLLGSLDALIISSLLHTHISGSLRSAAVCILAALPSPRLSQCRVESVNSFYTWALLDDSGHCTLKPDLWTLVLRARALAHHPCVI